MQSKLLKSIFLVLSTLLISSNFSACLPLKNLPCNFDEIQPRNIDKKTEVKYSNPTKHGARLKKRDLNDTLFKPIRINWSVHDLEDSVDTEEVNRLTKITRAAVSVIQKLLSGKLVDP